MSDIAFVNVNGYLNDYFRFNSCLISACALKIILLYYYLFEPISSSGHINVLPASRVKPPILKNYYHYYVGNINAVCAAQ